MADPTKARLRELFEYDADAGHLIWRTRPVEKFATVLLGRMWNTRYAGTIAGSVDVNGYRRIGLDGKLRQAHRLVWVYANGPISDGLQVDHINGNRDDNRLENLRLVTNAENGRNSSRPSDNTSGVVGVCWHKRGRKWQASIQVDGRQKHLGRFDTIEAAATARAKAERDYGYHPGHGKVLETRNATSH